MIIFHAHTGTTLLNILNLKANQFASEISDIYISNSARMPYGLIQFTRESGLFRNVIVINPCWQDISEQYNIHSKFGLLFCKALSLLHLQRHHSQAISKIMVDDRCDVLITHGLWGKSLYFVNYFYHKNKSLRLHIVDEGIGTESTSFQILTNPKRVELCKNRISRMIYDLIWLINSGHIFNSDIQQFMQCFTDYYLYNPRVSKLYHETSLTPHTLLPFDSNNKLTPLLSKLLDGIDNTEYIDRNVWILSDYDVLESHPYHLTFKRILEITLASFSQDDVILKGHPNLSLNDEYYSGSWPGLYLDNRKFQLEALYSQVNLNDKILITRVSSAVFYPKYMFNAEPYVILTYKISPSGVDVGAMDKLVESLRGLYANKDRIYVPRSMDDFEQQLRHISAELHDI
ncbi:hypothetical protein J6A32_08740 [Methanocorpusculum sp.]|nr:hypothetical protein [Methanocorpusculum sp.]